ncbi:alkaline phosphatase [Pontibacter silvestris]|uniref:Alkaline phosphatase n=1 Tax=Pontibacter silvestris TaxID=2305183 RepID=A0ABW4X069_9BACT|nr:alkaline phosphatase [Pontibacter silvestris]MCC9137569.1 alkaline phosphatase [Pontibacter silvestris]
MHRKLYTLLLASGLLATTAAAQTVVHTTLNAHSHNDYLNNIPFFRAYHKGFGSIEADVFPLKGELYVAHEKDNISKERTLSKLYLEPALAELAKDETRQLSLLIDIKENHQEALRLLVKQLKPSRSLLSTPARKGQLTIIISGDRPQPAEYTNYPDYIFFDDNYKIAHTPEQWERVGLVSTNFRNYSNWNGKGVLIKEELARVKGLVDSVHAAGKNIRFWAAPDSKSAWLSLMGMGVDMIGTDRVEELGTLMQRKARNEYKMAEPYSVYTPTYKIDSKTERVKNVIFLIGDGMGLSQVYATYTANRGQLNLFQMRNIGLSVTNSADAYGTDSAAGATAMATGEKTNNRAVGVNSAGEPLQSLVAYASEAGKKTAVIAACDLTDATPAAFYAHQQERLSSTAIAQDMLSSPVDIVVGAGRKHFEARINDNSILEALQAKGYVVADELPATLPETSKLAVLVADSAVRPVLDGRGDYLLAAFSKVTGAISDNDKGFFLMLEGSQIDHGGHANNFPQVVTENADFDKVVGEALRFADQDGETLVIVTADHETGGLTLLDGNISEGYVIGEFSTDDHTGIPVPVYAYGPHSNDFRGVYQNNEIFQKLLALLSKYE